MKKRHSIAIFTLLFLVTLFFPKQFVQANEVNQKTEDTIIVYLDPGHGGAEPGTTPYGTPEKVVNLQISKKIERKLNNLGYTVIMSRTGDTEVPLLDRPTEANELGADVFVSVHNNAMPGNNNVSGIETYYYKSSLSYPPLPENEHTHNDPIRISQSRRLANNIHDELIRSTNAYDRGVQSAAFAVTREAQMPAVLLELGFMTNRNEHAKLLTNSYQETLSTAVVGGINQYYGVQQGLTSFEFVDKAKSLPTVSEINRMNASQFGRIKTEIEETRALYDALSPLAKRNSNALRWENYLSDKESAIGFTFVNRVKTTPSVSTIENMSPSELTNLSATLQSIRNSYNTLSAAARHDDYVAEWYGYLTLKEDALDEVLVTESEEFVDEATALPSISAIGQMNTKEFNEAKTDIRTVRDSYEKLSLIAKQDEDVIRWENYLEDKEVAVGLMFIEAAKSLPSTSVIETMTSVELESLNENIQSTESLYNNLSSVAQQNEDVSRWKGYVSLKGTLAENLLITEAETFVSDARVLPSISEIIDMSETQFSNIKTEIQIVRNSYEVLSSSSKKNPDVIRWNNYLADKEAAIGITFVEEAKKLPSTSAIEQMNAGELTEINNQLQTIRAMYESLPLVSQQDNDVSRWENYLSKKENTIINLLENDALNFVEEARKLPSISTIQNMNQNQFTAVRSEIQNVRALYDSLLPLTKQNEDVIRWNDYLVEKENAVAEVSAYIESATEAFINHSSNLPSVSSIQLMDTEQLEETKDEFEEVRLIYNNLSGLAKENSNVIRWEGYLTEKEEAISNR